MKQHLGFNQADLQELPWAYIKLCLQHARVVQGVHAGKNKCSFGKHIAIAS
jgi:hypothetical protein